MKKGATKFLTIICGIALLVTALYLFNDNSEITTQQQIEQNLGDNPEDKLTKAEMSANRYEYFFKKLRDPATNTIPRDIRARELRYAKTLPTARQVNEQIKSKNPSQKLAPEFQWSLAGPPATGGRTRALGIDQRDPNIVIAGGVSGGIWKSTDGGNSWTMKNPNEENLSVTSLAQDPTNPDTWYYTAGEFRGQTASEQGSAFYWGDGIFKSTNNGETWDLLPNTSSDNDELVDKFNTVSRVIVSPTTGSVFIASNGFGIYRSTDEGNTFPSPPILGTEREQLWADIDVGPDGRLVATISSQTFDASGGQAFNPGVFVSYDDGENWQEITPSTFPENHERSVIKIAQSAPDTVYVQTYVDGEGSDEDVRFHFIDLNDQGNLITEDRSNNLPDFGTPVGYMSTQSNYNMLVDVKPNDPDFVLVGGINLFRSRDGFATSPTGGYDNSNQGQKDEFWIGGYIQSPDDRLSSDQSFGQYPNQHPDQHVIVFDPNDPNKMWVGTDGGVYLTDDILADRVTWTDQNEGYIVTQFYASAIPSSPDDDRFMGGTQDNGTPIFTSTTTTANQTFDISSGDGGYSFFSETNLFVSSQRGRVIRWNNELTNLEYVYPSQATSQLFIHPYALDPNDDNIMYYPEGNHMWRNTTLGDINDNNSSSSGTTRGWQEYTSISLPSGYNITALEVSNLPSNVLYFGGYSDNGQPAIRRLDNASSSTSPVNIDLPNNSNLDGAYVSDIALNPANSSEAIVILSNYNVPSIWHTTTGGNSWENIEGNLNVQSIRSASMIPGDNGTVYVVGTSTGIYSTQQLNGTSTSWGQEGVNEQGVNELGYAVTEQIASRINGDVAAGTHGRGMYLGSFLGTTSFPSISINPNQGNADDIITITANNFTFRTDQPNSNRVSFKPTQINDRVFCSNVIEVPIDTLIEKGISAEIISVNSNSIEVKVPRGVLPSECAVSNSAEVIVEVAGIKPPPKSFQFLIPDNFSLKQNYPNPFNPSTTIQIDLARDSRVTLSVYDILGQKVLEPIFEDEIIAGTYYTSIDLSNLASGVYIYRIVATPTSGNAEPFVETRKMTLVK